jgi:uncharacterized lipoprotein NlpE involved in copper resistance
MMKKALVTLALVLGILGCTSSSKFVDGTSVQLGAYIPWEQNIYGLELVSYVNGTMLKTSSNVVFSIERDFCATNTYLWGMLETRECTKTKVETNGR